VINESKLLKVGDSAPDFTVKDHHGKTVNLKALRGKKVVLWFYPKADTPGCTAEGCAFRDRASQFAQKHVQVLGVSFDSEAENDAFAKKFGFEFPLLCDTERAIGIKYGACNSVEDKYAQRIAYVINVDGKIAKVYPKVDAATFPQTVLAEV
jgi:thioredoxin-dependent peroxiredoxin